MVVLYTNENNPAALKIIISKNYVKSLTCDIKIVSPHDRSIPHLRHLPYLEVEADLSFFLPNAAVCYLLPVSEEIAVQVYEWLEWEAKLLSPGLAQLAGSSKNDQLKTIVGNYLKILDNALKNKNFLIENSVTAADISIWSTLYPLYKDPSTSKEYLIKLENILKWMKMLEGEKQFLDAVNSFKIDPKTSYSALLNGAKYLYSSAETEQQKQAKEYTHHEAHSKDKESPQHCVESVTNEEIAATQKAWQKNLSQLPKRKVKKGAVLPVPGEKNILITSALPYVNNVPHLGNIIGCVLSADVFARFCRLCNYNTLYICGTDEYGTATETKALEEGLSCQQICDKYFKIHSDIYKWFNISFDHFGRTSSPEQTQISQDVFLRLNDNGFTFTQSVEQLHCEKCDRFLADRFVEGGCPHPGCNYEDARGDQCDSCGKLVNATELKNPRCKICSSAPKLKTSNQFFIDLPKLEPLLLHWVKNYSPGWSNNAQVIARSWLKEGLKPRCITRDLKWGVPVPLDGYRNKVFYVWFDAPLGYISITKGYNKDYEKWWKPAKDVAVSYSLFMAKDNVPFHTVLFPSILLGTNRGYLTNWQIMATEYLNYEDGKFSKSRGVGVFGNDAQSTGIPSDVWRFYLLYVRPESQDSCFSWSDLVTKTNSELLNNLGNFINRALVFAKNNFNKTIPKMHPVEDDFKFLALCTREFKSYVASLEKAKLRDGIRHILSISRHGNQYMQLNQPWVLFKGTDEEKLRAGTVVGICCNVACLLATLLQPYMPDTSSSLQKQLNTSDLVITIDNVEIANFLLPGHKLGDPSPLFAKIDVSQVEELKKKFAGTQSSRKNDAVSEDIKIIQAEVAKQADKVRLLKSSGVEKSIWQPEVAILLDLKKKLEAAQKVQPQPPTQNGTLNSEEVKTIEDQVAQQGLVVRKLKESGADKSAWQPEVDKLLALKSKLAAATGVPVGGSQKSKKSKK